MWKVFLCHLLRFMSFIAKPGGFAAKTFSVFAYPDINTRGVGRIRDGYANPRRSRGFAYLSRILPTPRVFISGYANTRKKFFIAFIK